MCHRKCILQVCAYAAPYPGNFIGTLQMLAVANQKKGFETIFAFCETAKEQKWCQELSKQYKVYYLPVSKARIKIKTYSIMRKIYKENNVVIAHSHFELYDMAVNLMAPKYTKVFWHLHDSLELSYSRANRLYRVLWRLQYGICSKKVILLSASEKAKKFAIKLGFASNNAYFLANGIDLNRIKEMDICQKYDFLMYGWDFQCKGVDLMLDAIQLIGEEEFRVGLVAGEQTWEQIDITKYRQLIRQETVKDVSKLYHASKCFLHISRSEGLSYALLEAVYAGCVIICSDIEQNLFATIFPTVIMVENENIQMIAQTMLKVLRNEFNMDDNVVKQAKQIVEKEFSLQAWIRKVQRFYFDE